MTRAAFERELKRLQDETLALGSMVQRAITEAVDALMTRDLGASRRLVLEDQAINEKRFAIEADTLVAIATQQPMAGDLRGLAAILEIITELERIGDYAKGISRISLMLKEGRILKPLSEIRTMSEKALDMLSRALDAFVRKDVGLARSIPLEDDEVDALYNQLYQKLLNHIIEDQNLIDEASQLLWVAHNLERAADRVTNICERVVFTSTGEMVEMDQEEGGPEGVH
ncbi:MAG: phosphate signaling complex protein PhoU [Anaerolineales bacterium]|nr:MAG: phosphate signaling complex protein PhoU [Anaerolineales bacterium]